MSSKPSSEDEPSLNGEEKPKLPFTEPKEPKQQQQEKVRASKLEYKTVNQIIDRKNYGYKLVESLDNADDKDVYEEYIFVERRKYDERNLYYKTFVDVKSELLRDVLRKILHGANTVSMLGDKPEINVELLYHYLPQLESSRDASDKEASQTKLHLDLLVGYLQAHFESTIKTLPKLLENGEITFDLLWALFPPMTIVYSVCDDSEQPHCSILDSIEEKQTISKDRYLALQVHRIHHDGKVFGEASDVLIVSDFPGVKPIQSLDAFPLRCHENMEEVKSTLIKRGRRFTSLSGVIHCAYTGLAHVKRHREKTFKFNVKGRLMVDPLSFKEHNPNYSNPRIYGTSRRIGSTLVDKGDYALEVLGDGGNSITMSRPRTSFKPEDMTDEEFLICSATVLGFTLDKRAWAEFAVSCIEEIQWTSLPFDTLVIPETKKNMLQALVQEHTMKTNGPSFDDVVEGKGKGLIVLLHGPPGVGKTLTAEAISEHGHRPLYRVTAGDLGLDAGRLEESLSELLDLVAHWKAILLLDEADVFLEARERHHLQHNMLVSVFLRQLEYFQGVMLLTTNRVTTFDDAVHSRIHLGIKYDVLSKKAKKEIWITFIEQAKTASIKGDEFKVTAGEMDNLASRDLNGRQIKNTVRMACALAIAESTPLSYKDLINAIEANADFDDDFRGGAGHSDAMRAYH